MLLADHYIAESRIHGMGVFSAEFITKGSVVWEYNSAIDIRIHEDSLVGLPEHVIKRIQTHAEYFPSERLFVLGTDGDYYMNHSDNSNLIDEGERMLAARDITVGEELTCDYRIVTVLAFNPNASKEPKIRLVSTGPALVDRSFNYIAR